MEMHQNKVSPAFLQVGQIIGFITTRMLSNQSKLFARLLSKGKEVYFLKVITLAVAFASSTLIILFSLNEFTYDQFHHDAQNTFRVLQRNTSTVYDKNRLSNVITKVVTQRLRQLNADSIALAHVKILNEISVVTDDGKLDNQKIHITDPGITNIFSFNIVGGSIEPFGKTERSAIISSSASMSLFKGKQAEGKQLKVIFLDDTVEFTVVAVFKDFPSNAHEAFHIFLQGDTSLGNDLKFDADYTGVYGRSFGKSLKRIEEGLNLNLGQENNVYLIQSLPDIYFGPRVLGEDAVHGDRYSIIILLCIAGLILFLALTNYINLTTLSLPHRSKELALKKLMGAGHIELTLMFARESFILTSLSLFLGIAILFPLSIWIESLLSIDLFDLLLHGNAMLLSVMAALLLIVGATPLIMVLKFTRATPTKLLSTETITFPKFKRVITFLQLGISMFLIVASLVIQRQVNYSLLKEPGQNHEQVVYLSYPEGLTNEGLRSQRLAWKRYHPNIVDVIATSQLPDRVNSKELHSGFYFMSVDPVFREFFDLSITEGNWFKANDGDSIFVVNKLGKKLLKGDEKNVIGVIEDFESQFNLPEKPMKINIAPYFNYNYLCVRILEVDIRRTVAYLENHFKEGSQPPKISYLNKRFEEWIIYQDRLNTLSGVLAILSAILSCCAIYGLSISVVRDKIKQIAIHKLHGATIINITRILVWEFIKQLLLAVLMFGPFTYIFLKEWLRNFVYSTHFQWTDPFFPLAYCSLVIILLCGFQALSLNRSDLTSALKG
jgi:putative ABC transport system permease protein